MLVQLRECTSTHLALVIPTEESASFTELAALDQRRRPEALQQLLLFASHALFVVVVLIRLALIVAFLYLNSERLRLLLLGDRFLKLLYRFLPLH